jgi:hypothetical protein
MRHALALAPRLVVLAAGSVLALSPIAAGEPVRPAAPAAAGAAARTPEPGTSRRLDRYSAALGLDPDQRAAAAILEQDHAARVREIRSELDGKVETVNPMDPESMNALRERAAKVRARTDEATTAFLADLKALLTPEQAEQNWPRLERLRRRDSVLPRGLVGGSTVDLLSLTDTLALTTESKDKVRPALEAYDLDMDRVLREAEKTLDSGPVEVRIDSNTSGGPDPLKDRREASLKVRDLNRSYVRKLAALLPEGEAQRFEELFRERAFRTVYRPTSAGSRLASAKALGDLTPDQRAELERIATEYAEKVRAANNAIAAATEAAETAGKEASLPMGLGGRSPEVLAARKARRDLDQQFASRMEKTLTPSQLSALPKPRSSGGGTFAVGGAVGGDGQAIVLGEDSVVATDEYEETDPDTGQTRRVKSVMVVAPGMPIAPPVPPAPDAPAPPPAPPPAPEPR